MGRPLTHRQLEHLSIEGLVTHLTGAFHHLLALSVSSAMALRTEPVRPHALLLCIRDTFASWKWPCMGFPVGHSDCAQAAAVLPSSHPRRLFSHPRMPLMCFCPLCSAPLAHTWLEGGLLAGIRSLFHWQHTSAWMQRVRKVQACPLWAVVSPLLRHSMTCTPSRGLPSTAACPKSPATGAGAAALGLCQGQRIRGFCRRGAAQRSGWTPEGPACD